MSACLHLSLSRALLCGVLLPSAALLSTPAVVQAQIWPNNSVMASRLEGTWSSRTYDYIFSAAAGGRLDYKLRRKDTGRTEAQGQLVPDFKAGLMRGDVRYEVPGTPDFNRSMRAWVDDTGKLWLQGYNADLDNAPFPASRTAAPDQAAAAAWVGRWRTSRGDLEIRPDGPNFVAWITRSGDTKKERVAFKADGKAANGAWDSEYTPEGRWEHKPVQFGDLSLALSADGKSFTGWSTALEGVRFARKDWTGQRIDAAAPPPADGASMLEAARRWQGAYFSSSGSKVVIRAGAAGVDGMGEGSRGRPPESFRLLPNGTKLEGDWVAGGRRARLAADASQPEGRIEGSLIDGPRTDAYTLCRIQGDGELVYSAQSLWTGMSDARVRRENDGSFTLFATLHVRAVGPGRTLVPGDFSARLPEHARSDYTPAYYNPATDRDDGAPPELRKCGEGQVVLRYPRVDSSIRRLVVRHGAFDTAEFDVSSATRDIGRADRPPAPDQAALLRVLEGRWRERESDSLWRFSPAERNGAVSGATWRPVDGEGAAASATFSPAQDGRTLTGEFSNGARLLIERNTLGEVRLIRPAQGASPQWSTELIKVTAAPAGSGPTTPSPPAPAPAPAPSPAPAQSPAPSAPGFKPLNRVDVRVDRVVVARGYPTHQVHAYVTVKNTSPVPQHFTSGFLRVTLADADGVSWERSEPYRATGEPAELFMSTPVIQPGGELKVRYVFLSDPDARLTTLTFVDGPRRAEFRPGM